MQDKEFGNKWVGSDISCCSPCTVVSESMSVLSGDVISSGYHDLDLALKSPNIVVKDGWSHLTKLRKKKQTLLPLFMDGVQLPQG